MVALANEADRAGDVEADVVLVVHLRHQLERAHVHLLDLRRAAEARHEACCVPRRARAYLPSLLEDGDADALRREGSGDGGTRDPATDDDRTS